MTPKPLNICFAIIRWAPVVFITAVIVWSYYAYVIQMCLCKYYIYYIVYCDLFLLLSATPRPSRVRRLVSGVKDAFV